MIGSGEFSAYLIVIPDHTYDVIIGIDWLSPQYAVIDCFDMVGSFVDPGNQSFVSLTRGG